MTDIQRLHSWFESGQLTRPDFSQATTVDLIQALYSLAGSGARELSPNGAHLKALIGQWPHYVFVVIDGMGQDIMERTAPDGFMRTHCHQTLQPVFPSTTSAAITSFATASYPAAHGITGWWVYFPEHNTTSTILPFVERFTSRPLLDMGISPDRVFTAPSVFPSLRYRAHQVVPTKLRDSVYTKYITKPTKPLAFTSVVHGFTLVADHVDASSSPTFTWLYLPGLDTLAHVFGTDSQEVSEELNIYDHLLRLLEQAIGQKAKIVVTADHGHVNVPESNVYYLDEEDPIMECLATPPSGEPTVPMFHLKPGAGATFEDGFRTRFGNAFALISTDEVDALRLLGPNSLSQTTRSRLGDYLALAPVPSVLHYRTRQAPRSSKKGFHGGLTPREMTVPLILS